MVDVDDSGIMCEKCRKELSGLRYILHESRPYCVPCYERLFCFPCQECTSLIGTESRDLAYKDKHWHDNCFLCSECGVSLVDKPFAHVNYKLFCADCHERKHGTPCDGCGQSFKPGMKKYEFKGKQWHEHCFKCGECDVEIGSNSFIPADDKVVCINCYEDKYALHCIMCNKVINKGGLTYKNTPFHRECFNCCKCRKPLANDKFASKDGNQYCVDCYSQNFSKQCCRCEKPIIGVGGTKFISFEGRNWHSTCFNCYRCRTELAGRGFLTDGTDILCPDCGKD